MKKIKLFLIFLLLPKGFAVVKKDRTYIRYMSLERKDYAETTVYPS